MAYFFFGWVALAAACADQTNPTPPITPNTDDTPIESAIGLADAGGDATELADARTDASGESADAGLTGQCASSFGDKLTAGFGRLDGIVYAVQKPSDTQCVLPNDDHVIVQVLMGGAVYRMVVNVLSTGSDPMVRYATKIHALPAPAFSEGWHSGADIKLDYPTTLDIHNASFTPYSLDDLVAKIVSEVRVGDRVSVYAQSGAGRPESAHLIHRNSNARDGAIVVRPTSDPKFLMFHFDEQLF